MAITHKNIFSFPVHLLACVAACTSLVFAQRPVMLTESATTSGRHRLDLFLGGEYFNKQQAPALDRARSMTRVGVIGWHQGVADNVNLDIDWRGYLFAKLGNGASVNDWGDVTISTRVRFLKEKNRRPALGLRTSFKLPNTKYVPYGLGSNQADYYSHLLVTKHFGDAETRLNVGFGIVGDPKALSAQDDVYLLSGAVIVPASSRFSLFAEVYGLTGYYDDDDKLLARFGGMVNLGGLELAVFGSARLAGSNIDIGGAFEASESWSIGLALRKTFELSFLKEEE